MAALLLIFIGLVLASCNGKGGGKVAYPKVPTHPIYGDMPQLEAKWDALDQDLKARKKADIDKFIAKQDLNGGAKADAKWKQEEDKADAEKEKEVAAENAKITGRAIPFEVTDGTGYEVQSVTVAKGELGGCSIAVEVKVTNVSQLGIDLIGTWSAQAKLLDDSGNEFNDFRFYINTGDSKPEVGKVYTVEFAVNGYPGKLVFTLTK
jgi:hypothetical protein